MYSIISVKFCRMRERAAMSYDEISEYALTLIGKMVVVKLEYHSRILGYDVIMG